ncbi:MAG: sodium:solute symporter family transporter [Spartobacteria bacterium]
MHISMIDVAVIAIYLIGITAFGIWVGYRREATSEQYFLASHSLNWFTVGAAVFTSKISTIHLVGLASGGAKDGMVIGNFELMACSTLILLALVFAPFYINSGVKTLPQFLECRYCPSARTFMAVIGLLGALLIHIGISLFAAAKVFESFLGVPMIWTIIVLSLFTVVYTVLGGLKAVVMTENIQVVLLLFGATLVTVLGFFALPSVGIHSMAEFRAALPPDHLKMLHPLVNSKGHLSEFSWLGILLGYPILGIWYWCADQTHVQRVLAANSLKDGQNGALFAGFLKITPVFLMVLPGVIGYVLWQKGAFQLGQMPGTDLPDYNTMLPSLINHLVPVGLKGLLAACMAAALMSCMAAALNSCATLISMDIVKRMRPEATDKSVVFTGRVATAVIMVLAMLWSTQGNQFGTIFEAINKIPMTFAPAVTTVFVFGVLWKRGTKEAAMTTLYLGSLIGVVYFIIDMPGIGRVFLGEKAHPDFMGLVSDPAIGLGVPFMLVGPFIALVCFAIYIVTSLLTPAMDEKEVAKVCWDHPLAFMKGPVEAVSDPRIVTLILLGTLAVIYFWLR